jgi:hypothetical protein
MMKSGKFFQLALMTIFFLALMICFSLAAQAADQLVTIAETDTVLEIQDRIQEALLTAKPGDTVQYPVIKVWRMKYYL